MTKPEWGQKRTCQDCGAKFYDMLRTPIVCPKCGAEFAAVAAKPKRPKPEVKVEAPPKKKKPEAAEVDAELADDEDLDDLEEISDDEEEEDEDLIEDASDLGDDDEDVAEVMEKIDGKKDV